MSQRNPLRGLAGMLSDMERMRHLGMTGVDQGYEARERTHADAWSPTTDIFCLGIDLVIRLELPGVPMTGIDLTLSDGVLSVSGERETESDEAVTYWQRERSYGAFRRLFTLPERVTGDQIAAVARDGVLTVTVRDGCTPSGVEPHRITIGEGSG
jgi:HSP20 family protein